MSGIDFGPTNGHQIGIVLKELVRRAIQEIRKEKRDYERQKKESYGEGKEKDDIVTSADRKAQEIYVKSLKECFPKYGIIGEENNLKIPCTRPDHKQELYFSVDPLDGTKAFDRGESSGVGTMIALACGNEIISAYIGNINTEEIVGYRPGSDKVHCIDEYEFASQLSVDEASASEMYIQLREGKKQHTEQMQKFIDNFKDLNVTSGSIGTNFVQLWKGVVGGIVLTPNYQTPWDLWPVLGISRKLGYKFYEIKNEHLKQKKMPVKKEKYKTEREILITHPDYI